MMRIMRPVFVGMRGRILSKFNDQLAIPYKFEKLNDKGLEISEKIEDFTIQSC